MTSPVLALLVLDMLRAASHSILDFGYQQTFFTNGILWLDYDPIENYRIKGHSGSPLAAVGPLQALFLTHDLTNSENHQEQLQKNHHHVSQKGDGMGLSTRKRRI